MWTPEFVQYAMAATRPGYGPGRMDSLTFHKARDAAAALMHRSIIARTLPQDATLVADVITPECWVFTYCAGDRGLRVVRWPASTTVRQLDRERARA